MSGNETTRDRASEDDGLGSIGGDDKGRRGSPQGRFTRTRARSPRRERGAASVRVVLVGTLVLAAAIVALLLVARAGRGERGAPPQPKAWVTQISPRGELESPPQEFVWRPFAGATRYKVTIADADAIWPLFVKMVDAPKLLLGPAEVAAITRGRIHAWDVEALDRDGTAIARGGTQFLVRASPPPPDAAPR